MTTSTATLIRNVALAMVGGYLALALVLAGVPSTAQVGLVWLGFGVMGGFAARLTFPASPARQSLCFAAIAAAGAFSLRLILHLVVSL